MFYFLLLKIVVHNLNNHSFLMIINLLKILMDLTFLIIYVLIILYHLFDSFYYITNINDDVNNLISEE
jgi:hypothetical protein